MKLSYLLGIVASVHQTLAAGTPGAPEDLDKQYRVNLASADKNAGGCQGSEPVLRASYGDAFLAAKAAQDALKIIKLDRPNDPVGFAKWGRIARVFTALFGAGEETFKQRRFNVVQSAIDSYQLMMDDISSNVKFGVSTPPASIYCQSGWLVKLSPADKNPADPQERTIGETLPGVPGLLVSQPDKKLAKSKNSDFSDPCSGDHLAFTTQGFSAITFCPGTLAGTNGVKPSIQAEKALIQADDPIGSHRTMTEMWVHEWFHLLSGGSDPQAVSDDGTPLTDAAGNPIIAYGWDHIVNLAKNNAATAQTTPDTYAIFANAMVFDNFDWSTGKAVAFEI